MSTQPRKNQSANSQDSNLRSRRNPAQNQTTPTADEYADMYPNLSNVASSNECTGLMSTPPKNEDERENYQKLSGMQIPKKK